MITLKFTFGHESLPHEKFVLSEKKRKGDPKMVKHDPDYGPFVMLGNEAFVSNRNFTFGANAKSF